MNKWRNIRRNIPSLWKWNYVKAVIIAVVIALIFGKAFVNFSIFNPVKRCIDDFSMTDVYYQISNSETDALVSDKIVIVDITSQYKRSDIARTIRTVNALKPSLIVLDVIFEGVKDDFSGNDSLVSAVLSVNHLITDVKLVDYDVSTDRFGACCTSFFQTGLNNTYGYGNLLDNMEKRTIRKYSMCENYGSRRVYSLSTLVAHTYLKEKPVFQGHGTEAIDFTPTLFPVIHCDSVKSNPSLLNGKIVFIGTVHEESDMHYTPLGKMSGVELQAYMTQTQLNHKEVTEMSTLVGVIWGIIMCYFTVFVNTWLRRVFFHLRSLMFSVVDFLLMAFWVWLGFYCYNKFDYNLNLLYPLAGIGLAGTGLYWVNIIHLGRRGLRIYHDNRKKRKERQNREEEEHNEGSDENDKDYEDDA
jgi:CHASE2 domain-containing sensor protein